MPDTISPETERRALALFERLGEQPDNERLRARLLKNEPEAVLVRFCALERSVKRARDAMPTLIPGSADCDGEVIPPSHVGAFRLVERIGRGGMGDVWLGMRDDGIYEQTVAVKLIQLHALSRAGAAFEDERRFLARLEHPNIARLIDGGVTEDGLPWLAVEFIDGEAIDVACERLTESGRVNLFIKATDAVQYAHSRMVAHADIKPSNIMVDRNGRVKLLDFGIASLIGGKDPSHTGSGPLTREYTSPQRFKGGGPSVADDVYALGKTLGVLLGESRDPELAAIVANAQDPDEVQRYNSAAALIGDLERWRAQLPVSAMPDSVHYRAGKFVERHLKGVIATVAALILLSATSLIATSNYVRAERTRERAEQRFGEVRRLSHLILFDLYDELSRQPGTVAKRTEIARTAAQYLERLRVSSDAPTDLRLDTARSYRRLAAILGLPGVSNLGRPEGAAAALIRAEALLQPLIRQNPSNSAALAELGWVYADRWTLHADNTNSATVNSRARRAFDESLRNEPGNAIARLGRIATEKSEGYDLIWGADRASEALPTLRKALAELRATVWPENLRQQARSLEVNLLNRIGDATYYTDDIPGSLPFYREADALVDRGIAEEGPIPDLLILKGENAFNISGSLGDMGGHGQEALAIATKGVALLRQLLALGPDAAAEKKLLVLYGQQAALLDEMGRAHEALAPSTESIRLRSARLARSPGDPQRMRDLAIGLAPNAQLLGKAGQRSNACSAASQAVETWHQIRADGHLGALDLRKNLPKSEALKERFCKA